ncbi:DUF6461 domain-containing protein [Nonomuraea sp. NPDC059194]|uniref:DUF6461 domain-containing protein n=1 Tax=Nonomuraea sp. NPDC059194 TaxID=3346764 RepID=UPI0036CC3947
MATKRSITIPTMWEDPALEDLDAQPNMIMTSCEGSWNMSLEPGFGQGARSKVLQSLSRGGHTAINFYWTVNATNQLAVAHDGRVIAGFEIDIMARTDWWGSNPASLTPHLTGLPIGETFGLSFPEYRLAAFVLLSRLTGGQILSHDALQQPMTRYLITSSQ